MIKTLLEKIKAIDRKLDYIRIPEDKTTVEGKPLVEWIKTVGGKGIKVKDYYLLIKEE